MKPLGGETLRVESLQVSEHKERVNLHISGNNNSTIPLGERGMVANMNQWTCTTET